MNCLDIPRRRDPRRYARARLVRVYSFRIVEFHRVFTVLLYIFCLANVFCIVNGERDAYACSGTRHAVSVDYDRRIEKKYVILGKLFSLQALADCRSFQYGTRDIRSAHECFSFSPNTAVVFAINTRHSFCRMQSKYSSSKQRRRDILSAMRYLLDKSSVNVRSVNPLALRSIHRIQFE